MLKKNMVTEAQNNCKKNENIKIINKNLLDVKYEKSDFIMSYYTIQFINPKFRQTLINKIYEVNCDENWVWFLTNKGVALYNWSRYH